MSRNTAAFLSTENLLHNLFLIKQKVAPAKVIAMVKANAYGHGLRSTSLRIERHVDMLGVASINEALALRQCGVRVPILLMEGVFEPKEFLQANLEEFSVVFHNDEQVRWFLESQLMRPLHVWIKVDTGMGRLGFTPSHAREIHKLFQQHPSAQKPLHIMSHLACADEPDHPLNDIQMQAFQQLVAELSGEFSLCNSSAIWHFPQHYHHYVRPGLALYGLSPVPQRNACDLGLKPVMTLQSTLIAIKHLKKGHSIGYGARSYCPQDMPIGVVAIGYGDGYPFSAKDGTPVLIHGKKCPLIGRVFMDMLTVDLRPCAFACVGDSVTLWGKDLPLEEVAPHTTSITYDIVSNIQHRVQFFWQDTNDSVEKILPDKQQPRLAIE